MNNQQASPAMKSLATWTPTAAPSVPVPSPGDLFGGLWAPEWMMAELLRATTEDPYAVCAAVGTVGRLWSPRTGETAAAFDRTVERDDPMSRGRQWWKQLPAEAMEVIVQLAYVEASALLDDLDDIAKTVADDDRDGARIDAARWMERRDNLASVARMVTGHPNRLNEALASLDRVAVTHASMWMLLAPDPTERMTAVSLQEPSAWWGRV